MCKKIPHKIIHQYTKVTISNQLLVLLFALWFLVNRWLLWYANSKLSGQESRNVQLTSWRGKFYVCVRFQDSRLCQHSLLHFPTFSCHLCRHPHMHFSPTLLAQIIHPHMYCISTRTHTHAHSRTHSLSLFFFYPPSVLVLVEYDILHELLKKKTLHSKMIRHEMTAWIVLVTHAKRTNMRHG